MAALATRSKKQFSDFACAQFPCSCSVLRLVTAVAGSNVKITGRSGEVSSGSSVSAKDVVPDREVLAALYHGTNGDGWTKNENWLSDGTLNTWYGIRANSDGMVVRMELERNNLNVTAGSYGSINRAVTRVLK